MRYFVNKHSNVLHRGALGCTSIPASSRGTYLCFRYFSQVFIPNPQKANPMNVRPPGATHPCIQLGHIPVIQPNVCMSRRRRGVQTLTRAHVDYDKELAPLYKRRPPYPQRHPSFWLDNPRRLRVEVSSCSLNLP
jgi:hypothetical protein